MSKPHTCIDCAALATEHRPPKPRPAPHGGPRSRRCATHFRVSVGASKAKAHDRRTVRIYGLEPGEYDRLYLAQGGTCAIPSCPATGRRKRLAVDHDHVTGEPRGLLCGPHNYVLLGRFAGDLQAALDYLADPPARRYRLESA